MGLMQNSFFIKKYVKADDITWFDNIILCQINHKIVNINIMLLNALVCSW